MQQFFKPILSSVILLISVSFQQLSAQCNPPMNEECGQSSVLCSLDQLNGYSCSNPSTIPSQCSPLCSQGGAGTNTSWWAFATQGGAVTITLTVGGCTNNTGIKFGIWGDCACAQEIACHSASCATPGSVNTINATLKPCKTYFLWVDGCSGDVCDFTLGTSGGGTPTLAPLGKINNDANMIIDACEGACSVPFFVNPQPGGCEPTYVWTFDGEEVGGNSTQVLLDLPEAGDFVICVTAYIGNPQSGSICAQQGPQCATIKVQPLADKIGVTRKICWESVVPGGYKWHSQRIFNSGVYREQFTDAACCKYDSVVTFTDLESPLPESVFFLTCDNSSYIDRFGRKHSPCKNKSRIVLPHTGAPNECDSSILLTAVNVDFAPTWTTQCSGGMVELLPNINILKPCNAGETYEFEYNWFKKNDPTHSIGTNERLLVKSVKEDYCLEVSIRTQLENEYEICTKTFCETFDESNLNPECAFTLIGNNVFCFNPIVVYRIDSLFPQKVNFYTWTVNGGQIISKADSSAIQVKWSFNPSDSGKICVSYNTDCGTSCEKCLTVLYLTKIAGEDFEHRGLSAYLDAKPNPNGMWRLISGPYPVKIEDPAFARTKITAFNYGYYCFEWTVTTPNCTLKDTLCVDLHNFKKASPEYPKLLFFERAKSTYVEDQSSAIVFMPNLIQNTGESFVNIDGAANSKLNYHWFDIYGKVVTKNEIYFESGLQRVNINSPIKEGMYFLVIELNGVSSVRKVCVIE